MMKLNLNKIEKIKLISRGPHEEVHLVNKNARMPSSKIIIAKYYLNFDLSDKNIQKIGNELKTICIIYHPALNKYFGFSPFDENNDPKLIIFSEYSPNGPLSKYIIQSNNGTAPAELDDTQKLIIAYGIASGMEFLHSKNIIHRHLKSDNIYLNEDLNPKISGFFSSLVPFNDSPIYLAPEIIGNRKYSKEGDVYAFGMIAYEIFTNKKPFEQLETPEQIYKATKNGKRPEFNSSTNSAIIKLIESCWSQDPSRRPTFEDIVSDFESNPNFVKGKDEKRFLDYIEIIKKVAQSKSQKKKQEKEPPKELAKPKPKQKQSDSNQINISKNQQEKSKQTSNNTEETEENANTSKRSQNRRGRGRKNMNKPENRIISASKVKPQPNLIQKGEIHFTSTSDFDNFQSTNWLVGDVYKIEFFPAVLTTVILLDASNDITSYVNKMKRDPVIFLDLEYVMPYKPAPPVCLFQFCCSSGAFLFKQYQYDINPQLRNFLSIESGCKFVGKGVSGDVQRLKEMFGEDFEIDLEDVENTRLLPYGESANFDQMVLKFAQKPMAQFKDKKVSRSNWSKKNLSMKQVIYSAFDVVSLYYCYPNFKPIRHFEYKIPSDIKRPSNIDIMKEFSEFLKTTKECKDVAADVEEIWNSKPEFVSEMLKLDLNVINFVVQKCLKVMQGHKLACKLCKKSEKFTFTFSLVNHCLGSHPECQDFNNGKRVDFKHLFLDYLFVTGRVVLENNQCLICDECFDSNSELQNHCWNSHFDLLNEFLKKKKNKKQQKNDDNDEDNDIIDVDDEDDNNMEEKDDDDEDDNDVQIIDDDDDEFD